jgi:hypothetical protein
MRFPSKDIAHARFLSAMLLCLLLGACGEDSKPKHSEASVANEDAELLKDLGFFTYVVPASSPWVISCGAGLVVTFGARCLETGRALATR